MFLRLSEKPIDLIKNPIIRIVRSVRVGLMVRSKFRPLGAQFEPLEIDFSAFRSQILELWEWMFGIWESIFELGGFLY